MKPRRYLSVLCFAAVTAASVVAKPAISAPPLYSLTKTVALGNGTSWDYLHYDRASDRVYIAHGNELLVLDAKNGEVVGHISGLMGSHGIAIDSKAGLGYADSRTKKAVVVFNLKSLQPVKTVAALDDADGMAYDSATDQVYVAGGDANAVLAINDSDNSAAKMIDLGGAPEFLVSDGAGSLYVNIVDKNEIARIDTKSNTVTAHWKIAPCNRPTGLAIDRTTHRLFSTCENSMLVVVNSDNGDVITSLPIGKGSDAAAFYPKRGLVFSSNKDGSLSIIREKGPNAYTVLESEKTAPGARTMTIDPETGRLFLVTADVKSVGAPKFEGGPPNYKFQPNTTKVLIYDPTH